MTKKKDILTESGVAQRVAPVSATQADVKSTLLKTITASTKLTASVFWETAEQKEEKISIVNEYFSNEAIRQKALAQGFLFIEKFPQAHRFLLTNPLKFQEFYLKKFKKHTKSIADLNDQEKYGVLLVKARELVNDDANEDFLNKDFKKIPNLRNNTKQQNTRGIGFGKWNNYDDESLF